MANWIGLRKQLYRQVRSQVQLLVGLPLRGVEEYQAQYEKEFRKKWRISKREELLQRLHLARIIYLADFHALKQSQKAQTRMLRSLDHQRPKVLCVEFLEARFQKKIDLFIAGKLTERDFLKAIQWQRRWNFPWDHYRPILRWAQKSKVRVIGVNQWTTERTARTLHRRDLFSAQKIAEIVKKFVDHQVIIIYGDWHLAEAHLPRAVQKYFRVQLNSVRVFQNSEKIFFQVLEKEQDFQTDLVRLDRDTFCLLSVPPWVKWQNYLMDLERQADRELREPEGLDYSDDIDRFLSVLGHDLQLPSPVGNFPVHSARDDVVWEKINAQFAGSSLKWIEEMIEESRSFYLPEIQLAYLGRASVNAAASLAMAVLYGSVTQQRRFPLNQPEDFPRLIWLEMIYYLGSKLINPKRKTETLTDIKSALASRNPQDQGREALRLALAQKMAELVWMASGRRGRPLPRPRRKRSYREAAQLLGGILGEKLFYGFRKKIIGLSSLQKLVSHAVDDPQFLDFYLEAVELIENLPDPFLSKTEKL